MENDKRRMAFIAAADDLFKEKGVSQTSVSDIAKRVNVTRSLFYHYFDDKQAIADAVIDCRIDEFISYVQVWSSHLNNDTHDALIELARIARSYVLGPSLIGASTARKRDGVLLQRFIVRSSELLANHFVSSRARKGPLMQMSHAPHPYESFYAMSLGIMGLMMHDPQVTDEAIADIIASALRINV